jgi:hypothetical protein
MHVRKVRNQNKVGKIILNRGQVEAAKRNGVPLEEYVKAMLIMIAKKRRWKWYFTKEKTNEGN